MHFPAATWSYFALRNKHERSVGYERDTGFTKLRLTIQRSVWSMISLEMSALLLRSPYYSYCNKFQTVRQRASHLVHCKFTR
jgi:hypothetical protein